MHLLIVEDDPIIARGLQVFLESANFKISHASTLKRAFELFEKEKYNLAVLDLGLTDGSGLTFLGHVRDSGSLLPIIILTAKTDEDSVVEGLQQGANDYMKKPFSIESYMHELIPYFAYQLLLKTRLLSVKCRF